MSAFLLDTHALIWWMDGGELPADLISNLQEAVEREQLFYSSVSFWEIGMLERKQRYLFLPSLAGWCRSVVEVSGANVLPISVDAAILSSRLPGDFHRDPADRLLVASAMQANATFVTRDRKILTWAQRTRALTVLAC